MIRATLRTFACLTCLASCGGSAQNERNVRRTVYNDDGTEFSIQVGSDGPTWNPVCRVRYPSEGAAGSYPVTLSVAGDGTRAEVERRFRETTKVPWTTVEVSPFGTVRQATLKSGGEFGKVSHEGLPQDGYDSDRMRRYWQAKVERSLSFLGSPPARDLSACPDDTSFVVLIGQADLWLHHYGVRWYSYPAWSEETGTGNLGDYADQVGVEVYGSPVPYFAPPSVKTDEALSARLEPIEVRGEFTLTAPPGRHPCDCEDGPNGCDACAAYAKRAAEGERRYEEARQKVEPHLGERTLTIRSFSWRKQWAAIGSAGDAHVALRLAAYAPQVDERALLPEELRPYEGMVRATYILNDSQQHQLHSTMLDGVSGEALVNVECRGVFEGTSILNCTSKLLVEQAP